MSIEVCLRRGYRFVPGLLEEDEDCIVRRYKNYLTVMFRDAITYDWKGPFHIWDKESPVEKKENDKELAAMRAKAEPTAWQAWEAEQQAHVAAGRRRGCKPFFRFTAFARKGKARGIDWFR